MEKGYLEDLWPYIENGQSMGRASVIEAPLKVAEINGGLCVGFASLWLPTLPGAKAIAGGRTGWTVGDGSAGVYTEPCGIKLAMSSSCADKDAAWQYIRRTIYPQSTKHPYAGFAVTKTLDRTVQIINNRVGLYLNKQQ